MFVEWEVQVCDLNFCYNKDIFLNFVFGEIEIFVLLEFGVFINLDIYVKLRGVVGIGCVVVELFDINLFDDLIIIGFYDFEVFVVISINDFNIILFIVFFNLIVDYFNICGGNGVDWVVLYNVLGCEMCSFNVVFGQWYYIGDLLNGLYLVSMVDNNKGIVKMLCLKKSFVCL